MTALEIRRREEHRCIQCGQQDTRTIEGKCRCERCELMKKAAKYHRQLVRARQGKCIICGKADPGEYYTCPECRAKNARFQREHRERLKWRNSQNTGMSTLKQK